MVDRAVRLRRARDARKGIPEEPRRPVLIDKVARDARPYSPPAAAEGLPSTTSQLPELRMVYLDSDRAASCVERLAVTPHGVRCLEPPPVRPENVVVEKRNLAFLLARIAARTPESEAFDLCQGTKLQLAGEELHPGQVLIVRGRVASAADARPGSLLLSLTGCAMRVLVEREHGLHLNQRYLTEREVRVIGILHSVPRTQLRAVAVFTAHPQSSLPSSFSTDGARSASAVS